MIAHKEVWVLPDNDEPGFSYARTVATAILEANPQAKVRIVVLPDLPVGGDFYDWRVAQQEDGRDDPAVIDALGALCRNAESVTPATIEAWKQSELAKASAGGMLADRTMAAGSLAEDSA